MPDRYTFCCVSRIATNHLVLNGGEMWIEFCTPCADRHVLTNAQGEVWTIAQLWRKCTDASYVRSADDIATAQNVKDREEAQERESEAWEYAEHLSHVEEQKYWEEVDRVARESYEDRMQLIADAWDNFVDRCLWGGKYTPPNYLIS